MPRGGRRAGSPGKSYGSRTDLNLNRAAPGQQYGKATAQEQALAAVPIQPPSAPDVTASAEAWTPLPGDPAVTALPDEPITAGLNTGPGAGPEALPTFQQADDEPDLDQLLPYLPFFQKAAMAPNSKASTRIFYRNLVQAKLKRQMT